MRFEHLSKSSRAKDLSLCVNDVVLLELMNSLLLATLVDFDSGGAVATVVGSLVLDPLFLRSVAAHVFVLDTQII